MADDWQSLLATASQLRRLGRVEEAIAAYKRLLAVNPELADSWYNLAWLQRQARQFEAALASYERSLALNVREPEEVHLNRAVIYSDHLQRREAAETELEAALERKPDYLPALLNLGNLREGLGDRDGARDAYRRALAIDPGNRLALARLAGASHARELDQDLAARLTSALQAPGVSPPDRASLGFALAGLLDAAGRYEAAFEAARAANLASRDATGARYDRDAAKQFIDRLIGAFDAPAVADATIAPAVFICGMFRSGSTLVEQMVGMHSGVTAAGELDLIPDLAARIPHYPGSIPASPPEVVDSWRHSYLQSLPSMEDRRLITDKRPDNFLHIGLIKTLFPSAKIVHTRRNRLDNLLSLYFLHLDPAMSYALDLEDGAHWYAQYERLMEHWKALYPEDIVDVDYDALVREPAPVIQRLLEFLQLDPEDDLLDFHRSRAPVRTASVWQVREPLHSRSSGRWRNYAAQLKPLINDLGD
jgi:tetratricopeptide (TPR) repeat protein